jgi:hypothetical protein
MYIQHLHTAHAPLYTPLYTPLNTPYTPRYTRPTYPPPHGTTRHHTVYTVGPTKPHGAASNIKAEMDGLVSGIKGLWGKVIGDNTEQGDALHTMQRYPHRASTFRGRLLMSLHWDRNERELEPETFHIKREVKIYPLYTCFIHPLYTLYTPFIHLHYRIYTYVHPLYTCIYTPYIHLSHL